MRPVNLIPLEERRGEQAPLRSGPLAYIFLGALVAVLVAVTALVLVNNQISDRKSDVAQLKREDALAKARAERLAAYTQFQNAARTASRDGHKPRRQPLRLGTGDARTLADPSFQRVVGRASTRAPRRKRAVAAAAACGTPRRARRWNCSGCTTGQEDVARFVTALKDIDGVTRVGVESSELSDKESAAGAGDAGGGSEGGSAEGAGADCRTRKFIAKFEIVVAFDAAPVPLTASSGEATASATEQAETTSNESSESSESSEGG